MPRQIIGSPIALDIIGLWVFEGLPETQIFPIRVSRLTILQAGLRFMWKYFPRGEAEILRGLQSWPAHAMNGPPR